MMEQFKLAATIFGIILGACAFVFGFSFVLSLHPSLFWIALFVAIFGWCYLMAGDILKRRARE